MLRDLETHPTPTHHHADICILGAGIAGLVLATRLANRGLKIALLEAGGLTLEPRSQAIYQAQMASALHTGTTEGRFRVFGGSSTRWGGQLLPYTPDIFAPSPTLPSAPWPLAPETLTPYYPEVLRIMGLPAPAAALPFDGSALLTALGHPPVPLTEDIHLRYSKWASFGRRNLANTLGRTALASPDITVFLHANALVLETEAGRVISAQVRNYAGAEFRFTATHFIVATGTIESSRLLLASDLGNEHDQLGRYFHDHISVRAAAVEGSAREQVLARLGPFFAGPTLHTAKLEASTRLREREALPAVMAHFVLDEPDDSGIGAVRSLLRSAQRGDIRSALASTGPMLRGLTDVARLLYASRIQGRRAVTARTRVWLHIDMEQLATPDSRIRLADPASPNALDPLHQPRAVVDWHPGTPERTVTRCFAPIVREALSNASLAPTSWLPGILSGDLNSFPMHDTYHPMGGLRMGLDPHTSVVTPDLALHTHPNVHIASCATYPSGGSSNPTFTLMALSLRLADRLARTL
ncbi:MAG: GMC family oxidoreductase [Acidobacteriaceae bacterium]